MSLRTRIAVFGTALWITGACPPTGPALLAATPSDWTLESAIARAIEAAPETRAGAAEVAVRASELTQAGAWPNPTLEVRADNTLGLEDGRNGTDLTQIALSQPLAFARLSRQRRQAESRLHTAQAMNREQRLRTENAAAHAFHVAQFRSARLRLAEERLRIADELATGRDGDRDRLVRYLAPIERLRLKVTREQALQMTANAEGEYSEALSQLRTLLALAPDAEPVLPELAPVTAPRTLAELQAALERHAALVAAEATLEAARAGIDVARSRRYADLALNLFRERDFLGGARRDVTGIGVSLELPLWNRGTAQVEQAVQEVHKAEADRDARRRELDARLHQTYLHLGHLIEQAEQYRTELLASAERMFTTARRSFVAGETHVLALVDAIDVHFEARGRYLELLQESWREAADLRLAAGVSLIEEVQP